MERRSFLASLAALFVARKLPAAEPKIEQWHGVLLNEWAWTLDGVPKEPPMELVRFDAARFTRATTATYETDEGMIATAGIDEPRTRILPGIHTLAEMRALDE